MKSILFTFLVLILTVHISNAQWVQTSSGIGDQGVLSLAANANTIFAGTRYNGLYLSHNNGSNWIEAAGFQSVYSLAVNGNNIFAGANGAYLSTNNGTNWTQTLMINDVYSLAIDGNNIFAGTYALPHPGSYPKGIYVSTNNGTSWNQTSLNDKNIYSLAVNGGNIFAGLGDGYGVYLSTDNGTSWTQTSLNNLSVYSLAINGNYIFAGTYYGIYLSTDNGTSWNQTSLNGQWIKSLAVNGNNVFAGSSGGGVFVSNDNGASWSMKNEGLGNLYINALCILNDYIFAGTWSIYRRPISDLVGINTSTSEILNDFSLSQNYPNPFNPNTVIRYSLSGNRFVTLKVYDVRGNEIATLVNEKQKSGIYNNQFSTVNYQLSSGVYFYKLEAGDFVETKRMILLK